MQLKSLQLWKFCEKIFEKGYKITSRKVVRLGFAKHYDSDSLQHAYKIVIQNENLHKFSGEQLKSKEFESDCDIASYN